MKRKRKQGQEEDPIMLNQVDLSLSLSKPAFKSVRHAQVERLDELARLIFEKKAPVIILFEGWDAAGKGTAIRSLAERLDPRGFKVLSTQAPRTHETQKPWLWRFWMQIPRHGQMAIFDRSWYGRVLVERVNGLTPIPEWIAAYEEINAFERTLADDNTIFVKFWLHISREEQLRRYVALTQSPDTAWQVTAEDWANHRKYHEYEAAVEDMLANTHTVNAPWTVVPATDMYYKSYQVNRTIIERIEHSLQIEPTVWPTRDELEAAAGKKGKVKKRAKKGVPAAAKATKQKAVRKAKKKGLDGPTAADGGTENGRGATGGNDPDHPSHKGKEKTTDGAPSVDGHQDVSSPQVKLNQHQENDNA